MKNFLLLLFAVSFLPMGLAQDGSKFIDRNNVRSWLNSTGELFGNQNGGFVIKDEDDNDLGKAIFIAKLWFASDEDNVSIAEYSTTHNAGPIDSDSKLSRVWKIAGGDIKNLIVDFADGKIDNPISNEILTYPAKGNKHFGNLLIDKGYAPFKDLNQDGVYNPYDGDYPIIGNDFEDIVPAELLFTISHDNQGGVGVEFTTTMYSLQCDEITELENAVFTRHRFKLTKSDYDKFHYSIFYDPDLGCYDDDFIGTDLESQSLYVYNAKNEDGTGVVQCASKFEDVPVQGSTFLNQSMSNSMYFMNTAGSVPIELGAPNFADEYYQMMNSIWKDGIHLTKGETGYDKNSSDTTKFVFTGNPNNAGEWVQPFIEEYDYHDSRSIASFIQENAKKDEVITLDAVHHFVLNKDQNHIEQINPFISQAEKFRELYSGGFKDVCFKYTSTENVNFQNSFQISPNPNDGNFTIEGLIGDEYNLYNVMGKLIEQGIVSGNEVNLVTTSPGVYILELNKDSKAIGMAKVVVH